MVRKISLVLMLSSLVVWAPLTFASFDIEEECNWGKVHCLLKGYPVLTPVNDSRDNLLRLLSEAKSFALPLQVIPADITRSRDFYFAYHPEWDELTPTASVESEDTTLIQQLAALKIEPPPFAKQNDYDDDRENRFVSNNRQSVSRFITVLMADETLNIDQRRLLAQARLDLWKGATKEQIAASLAALPADSTSLLYKTYLTGAARFYAQDYEGAAQDFTILLNNSSPWLMETAQYMLMRTALNKSSKNSAGEYGDFDINKINLPDAAQAQKEAETYLQRWPEGMYAVSTRNMLRRIYLYQRAWPQLIREYEQVFLQTTNAQQLRELVIEYDNIFGFQFLESPVQEVFADAPLISYVELLRMLRLNSKGQPKLTQEQLDASKPIFEKTGKLALWRNLQLNLWYLTGNDAAVLQAITPAKVLPTHDILTFSEQVLYGEVLMAQKQWSAARGFWQQLLKLSQDIEQQQYIQAKLAATLVYSDDIAAIFAPDSLVTNLRLRSRVLKTQAPMALLRQQALQGPNNEERTIALHTLLVRDLTENHFGDWLEDKKIISNITPPVIGQAFSDVDLRVFDWQGDNTETGYLCRSLENTVAVLNQHVDDGHALNCLGEFFRFKETHVDLEKDSAGNAGLETAIDREQPYGQYDRQSYYQQVITSPKAEVEDKSYALYRAIVCYAPSGSNDCGGQDVDILQRKGWFTQLKTQYPGSPWAQKLKYYW